MKKSIFLTVLFFALGTLLFAQPAADKSAQVQSLLVYNFSKYIEWPPETKSNKFVVGVVGNNNIYDELNKLAEMGRKVAGQELEVRRFNSVSNADDVQILFISKAKTKELEDALSKYGNSSTLIITEKNGAAEQGSIINFVMEGGKWKFEINKTAAAQNNLKVSNSLLSLAIKTI